MMQIDPPGENEYDEEDPSADLLYYGAYVYTPGDYDEEWGTFNPDDEDWEAEYYRRLVPDFDCHYDLETRRWVCDCVRFTAKGRCPHSDKFRGEEIVPVSEEFL
jgi:hypothetical protein